jgi:6-phosphogluconolactonase
VNGDVEIVVVDDPAPVVAERLAEAARRGRSIVITGGSTPRRAYELAAELEPKPRAVHRMRGELGKDEGAEAYEAELGDAPLDLVLLGMGADGHIASLFPNEWTLEERARRVVGCQAHLAPFVDRITLTLPALRSGREVVFLVTGADKADAVASAFAGDPDPTTPASLVRSESGHTTAMLDRAAAAKL